MKLVKSLLLGSAAGLAAVAGAQAADLPVKKAAPVEYVRVCSTYGNGFFYIPGTETCLRVAGRVRFDMIYQEPQTRADDALGFRGYGRINIDTRTSTAYGLLRSYIRVLGQARSGAAQGLIGTTSNVVQLEEAFIQFGGLTAGRVTSFFSNPDIPNTNMGTLRFDDSPDINLLAYTFSFGNGFSATLSLEDGLERRGGTGFIFGTTPFNPNFSYGGQRMPDVVGNLKYTGTWGGAQLSGAVHQVRPLAVLGAGFPVGVAGSIPDTEYGWAIGASAYVNLPSIAPGDNLWIFATYAQGATTYSGFGSNVRPITTASFRGIPDATVNAITGNTDLTTTWNIAGGFTHNWTPNVRSSVFGSYANVEFGNAAVLVGPTGTVVGGLADFREWRVGANTFWSPVAGLNLGVEVIYADLDYRGAVAPLTRNLVGSDLGAIEGRIRVQRDF